MIVIGILQQYHYGAPSTDDTLAIRRKVALKVLCFGKCSIKLLSVLFAATLSLSSIAYVGSAAAKRCPVGPLGAQCCENKNDPCGNCNGVEDCLQGGDLSFEFASFIISPQNQSVLAKMAERIRNLQPGTVIEIGGYTDSTGSQAGNRALARMRAEAVSNELIRLGVPAQMLVVRGYGESRPVRSNATPVDRIQNRRVSPWVIRDPAAIDGQ